MPEAWFTPLRAAIKGNRREAAARYLQLATVAADGSPRNRTIVFRGFAEDSYDLLAVTDTRNEKVGEILTDARVELCWYFPVTREQFRIRALATILDSSETRLHEQRINLWQSLSDAASEQFFWAHPGEAVGLSSAHPVTETPPEHFVGLKFSPTHVDRLSLRHPQTRSRHVRRDGRWHTDAVNP